ncbi:hypothetical protein CHARACLAT_005207 [Characodon lateralis]|uniref:Uncharacterized protein n=1 Tax=Characodon lateralis TaxID=208331 RepID=A0ABU7DFT0_9TELE|nr:hypothetical protein [Characodon lateralis]
MQRTPEPEDLSSLGALAAFIFSSIFSESRETGNGGGERGKKCGKCHQGQDSNPGRPRRGLRPPYMDRAYISYDLKNCLEERTFYDATPESRGIQTAGSSGLVSVEAISK